MRSHYTSLVTLALLIPLAASADAQCYDTCAPHRHGLYGFSSAGRPTGGNGWGMRGTIRPFQGLVNPRYLPPAVEYVVVAPADPTSTQPQVYLPRDVRERKQAELEIASDSDLLEQPERQEPARQRPRDYKSPATAAHRPAAPVRVQVPQPELIAARSYTAGEASPPSSRRPLTSAAADDYLARSSAVLERLRTRRPDTPPRVAVEGSTVAAAATDNVRQN